MWRKWMDLNSLYGDDFKWARGLYMGDGKHKWPNSSSLKRVWRKWPEGFYGTLRPIHLWETHLSWKQLLDEER